MIRYYLHSNKLVQIEDYKEIICTTKERLFYMKRDPKDLLFHGHNPYIVTEEIGSEAVTECYCLFYFSKW